MHLHSGTRTRYMHMQLLHLHFMHADIDERVAHERITHERMHVRVCLHLEVCLEVHACVCLRVHVRVLMHAHIHTQERWEVTEGGFACALDLVKYMRANYADYFSIQAAPCELSCVSLDVRMCAHICEHAHAHPHVEALRAERSMQQQRVQRGA